MALNVGGYLLKAWLVDLLLDRRTGIELLFDFSYFVLEYFFDSSH